MEDSKKKVAEVHAEIVVDLTQEDVDDIMSAALDGGITYWCYRAEVLGDYLGDFASEQISRGGKLKLYGDEEVNGETKWWLDIEKFVQGFRLWLENGGDTYGAVSKLGVDTCKIDGEAADAILQYALMGEIIFG